MCFMAIFQLGRLKVREQNDNELSHLQSRRDWSPQRLPSLQTSWLEMQGPRARAVSVIHENDSQDSGRCSLELQFHDGKWIQIKISPGKGHTGRSPEGVQMWSFLPFCPHGVMDGVMSSCWLNVQ